MTKPIFSTRVRALLAALITFSLPPLLAAQEPVGTQEPTDSVRRDSTGTMQKPEAHTLKAVRIDARRSRSPYVPGYSRTATKTPALARDVPQSLTSVSRELIRDQSMEGIKDVVRYVPGMTIGQGEGNRDQVTIRGNSSTADFFVDGVRDDVQYFRDVYNLDRVEALKGSNAMVFGRGGGGGILNRVTKEPEWTSQRDISAEGGSFGKRRVTIDMQQRVSALFAARLNSMAENSESFRDYVSLQRSGVNPTLSLASRSMKSRLSAGYEHFRDRRTADRGIPSYRGAPVSTAPSTFFGNPDESYSRAVVNSASATLSHDAGKVQVRNHSRLAGYDKVYQNVYPGAVDATGSSVSISAYRNAVDRANAFNQTDVTWTAQTGSILHDLLIGAELGRQKTKSFRETGYFGGTAPSVMVPLSNPVTRTGVSFRQSATDADHETIAGTRSVYVQEQASFSDQVKLIGGVRYERFDVRYTDDRTSARLERVDGMFSPRAGLVVKPTPLVSLYASYGLSFLPGSGDQFSSLSDVTRALEPERFTNYETGVKWDAMDRLAVTAAIYRLDRTNTRSVNPLDPTQVMQTGAQRSTGFETSLNGSVNDRWQVAGGYTRQSAEILRATSASPAGARVPLVPRSSASLWNKVSVVPGLAMALGVVHQGETFAAIDNKVTLPAFTTIDAASFLSLGYGLRAQLNVENLANRRYYPTAQGNNNISPGAPRSFRVSLGAEF
jgi:catecholate siderophore receptor